MTFKARGIIFDTMFFKSDPENVFTEHNTQMAIMIAFEPYSHESSEKQKKILTGFAKTSLFISWIFHKQ
jgi:hypothetical protein